MTKFDPFDDQRRKGARHSHLSKEEKEKVWIFRELLWKAIDEKNYDISMVEIEKQLKMRGR